MYTQVGRLSSEGLGVVGNNTDVGFYIHPTLVLDGEYTVGSLPPAPLRSK
ncbi:hypothetical protein [Nostoc sp.]